MSLHQIHVFISHCWKHTGHYDTLQQWIFGERWSVGQASLKLLDYSVPKSHPITGFRTAKELEQAIAAKIARSHIVIIPTGMYAQHSVWIQKEIDIAKVYGKPILAVNPWGQQRKSSIVASQATKIVGWNKQPIVSTIWQLFRR